MDHGGEEGGEGGEGAGGVVILGGLRAMFMCNVDVRRWMPVCFALCLGMWCLTCIFELFFYVFFFLSI